MGKADTAIGYMNFVKGEAPRTAEPGFAFADWDELARLVDTERFVRVGKHGEAMSWPRAVELMHTNIGSRKAYTLRAATEVGDRVFLEMEERVMGPDGLHAFDSVYIFSFDAAGKITRLEVFMH